MKKVIYTSTFAGQNPLDPANGITWRLDIWRETDDPVLLAKAAEGFEAGVPFAELTWEKKDKIEVLIGASCTVRMVSPGDRTYIDLYTIKSGEIGLDIYRNGVLYWQGTLDAEFYEEPYQYASNYEVSLTFSDLGILSRLDYTAAGLRSIKELLDEAMTRAKLTDIRLDTSLTGLKIPTYSVYQPTKDVDLSQIYVNSANFYDNDGEPMTMAEVLEGVLQPLGMRLEQRAGVLYLYDMHNLCTRGRKQTVIWDGDRQTLGVDEVKNKVTITWSPNAATHKMLPDDCWPQKIECDPTVTNMDRIEPLSYNGCDVYTYHLTQDPKYWELTQDNTAVSNFEDLQDYDPTDKGFSIWLCTQGENLEIPMLEGSLLPARQPRFYKIVPHYDGEESEGVCVSGVAVQEFERAEKYHGRGFWRNVRNIDKARFGLDPAILGSTKIIVNGTETLAPLTPLLRTQKATIVPTDCTAAQLKVSVRMLMDPRYNPFESAVDFRAGEPQKEWEDSWKNHVNFVYVPIRLLYKNSANGKTYVWSSEIPFDTNNAEAPLYEDTLRGKWVDATVERNARRHSYICYYDPSMRDTNSGVMGWKSNRQCIAPTSARLQSAIAEGGDGQYIPLPPMDVMGARGGDIWMEIVSPYWKVFRYDVNYQHLGPETPKHDDLCNPRAFFSQVNWILFQPPQIEIVAANPMKREIDDEDVEYSGVLNPDASEDIDLSTICGTTSPAIPTAKGAYFNENGYMIDRFVRAGRGGHVEDLLIGTIYSQHAMRDAVVSGEAVINAGGVTIWHEANMPEKRFMLVEETQDLQMGTGDRTIIELSPDEYIPE